MTPIRLTKRRRNGYFRRYKDSAGALRRVAEVSALSRGVYWVARRFARAMGPFEAKPFRIDDLTALHLRALVPSGAFSMGCPPPRRVGCATPRGAEPQSASLTEGFLCRRVGVGGGGGVPFTPSSRYSRNVL